METFKKVLITIAIVLAAIAGTYTSIQWDAIVAKWETNAEREVFKETTAYNETAAAFLADCYKQYNDAETDQDKAAIMEYVILRYPNLDYDNIDNSTLQRFYKDCLNR